MKIQATPPTGSAQHFEVNETFFSTTDRRGIITSGNAVFSRTSGYSLSELIGQAHNVIRHPDVPRCVFHLLWEAARAGHSFCGYVKNHAKNGNHYWVFAVITPIKDGFLSVRIKPTTPTHAVVEQAYARLLAVEKAVLARGESERAAIAESTAALLAELQSLGFASYETFSHAAMNDEIRSRDEQVAARRLRLFPDEISADAAEEFRQLYGKARATYEHVNGLFGALHAIIRAAEGIRGHRDAVREIAHDFRLSALNAHISAHPLGDAGITIGTVAQFLNDYSQLLAGNVGQMIQGIGLTLDAVSETASNLSAARVQIEMLLTLIAETTAGAAAEEKQPDVGRMIDQLRTSFCDAVTQSLGALEALRRNIPAVQTSSAMVRKDIITLQVAQITGLTEASRIRDSETMLGMFSSLRQQIERAKTELGHLTEIVNTLTTFASGSPPVSRAIRAGLSGLGAAAS